MSTWHLDLLACPVCRGPLREDSENATSRTGAELWLASACGARYPVVRGVPRFTDSDRYLGSFSFEWNIHRRTQFDTAPGGPSERRFEAVTGVAARTLREATVLDAGVGSGRFADVVSRAGARVVCLDLSHAIDAAAANFQNRPNVACVQGDILAPPFPPGTFDLIFSIGVLHHTPDAEAAFRTLVTLLKPGGSIAIYVYARYGAAWRVSDLYRKITVHLPHRLLYALSHLAVPIYYLQQIPIVGLPLRLLLPISDQPTWRWRVLDTFDWYAPRYQSKHTYPEVYRWFRSEGLVDIELGEIPVCVRGRRAPAP